MILLLLLAALTHGIEVSVGDIVKVYELGKAEAELEMAVASDMITIPCKVKDSDECLHAARGFGPNYTCESSKSYCVSYAKDMRRCCPDSCGSGPLSEEECNETSGSGQCDYPNDAQPEPGCTMTVPRVVGCMEETALNYNPEANDDDGSCEHILGCPHKYANNYNPDATKDDGSCDFDDCGSCTLELWGGVLDQYESDGVTPTYDLCGKQMGQMVKIQPDHDDEEALKKQCIPGRHQDGISAMRIKDCPHPIQFYTKDGTPFCEEGNGNYAYPMSACSNDRIEYYDSNCKPKFGCTDEEALNYDETAHNDDGSCDYPVPQCELRDSDECLQAQRSWGKSYNCASGKSSCESWPKDMQRCCPITCGTGVLTEDDCNTIFESQAPRNAGECVYPNDAQPEPRCKDYGCTDEAAKNFNPDAKIDDESCEYVEGCTDPAAENYNAEAGKDDGSCTFPEPVCEAEKYLAKYTCKQLEAAGWDLSLCDCPAEPVCPQQTYVDQGYTCDQLVAAGWDMSGCQCEDVCTYVCQQYIDQGHSCQECEMAGLKCTPCDDCGGCACQKYIDQGYSCEQIESAGLDCQGCTCPVVEPVCEAEKYIPKYSCSQLEKAGWDVSACDCPAESACAAQAYFDQGYDCVSLLPHQATLNLDLTGCGCEGVCPTSCQQYLDLGFSCQECELAGLECTACDECGGCACKKYQDQGYTCSQVEQAGLDCSGCSCEKCVSQAYVNQGMTCATLKQAGMPIDGCGCEDVCVCDEYVAQGISCETLTTVHGYDCSGCECTPACLDVCKEYMTKYSFTVEQMAGYGIDCSPCI